MRTNHATVIAFAALVCGVSSILKGQAISPPVSDKFPFQVGTIMDGGTLYLLERPTKETPERRCCIDHQINSETAGELFIGNLHPTHEGAKLMKTAEAEKILDRIEARLKAYHGAEALEWIRKDPIDLESMSDEEAEEKAKDPKFFDRVATQMLLNAIQEYRESHQAEGGAEIPPTVPKSKSQ